MDNKLKKIVKNKKLNSSFNNIVVKEKNIALELERISNNIAILKGKGDKNN